MTRAIDLNCDMGESYGRWTLGDDAQMMQHISSANVACGAHAGDPDVMARTVRLARDAGVAIGAHPGYPDLPGFGRRALSLSPEELRNSLLCQLGALGAIARAERCELSHVKPHGALYNQACANADLARWVVAGLALFSRELPLVGLPGSYLEEAAGELGLRYLREGFADRAYEPNGSLRDRRMHGAMRDDPEDAAQQAVKLATGFVDAYDGGRISLQVDTMCVHGDTPGAVAIARAVREALEAEGIRVAAPVFASGNHS